MSPICCAPAPIGRTPTTHEIVCRLHTASIVPRQGALSQGRGTYAPPRLVQDTTTWIGSYTLRVRAPLTTLEVAWNENGPLRIMAFSRGDWEAALTAAFAQGS